MSKLYGICVNVMIEEWFDKEVSTGRLFKSDRINLDPGLYGIRRRRVSCQKVFKTSH